MRVEMIKRLQVITSRMGYALRREEIEYFQELVEERESCLKEIEEYNKKENISMTQEERRLLQLTKEQDDSNRLIFEQQFDEVKLRLKQIRINEAKSQQYINSYACWQAEGVLFDKRGR